MIGSNFNDNLNSKNIGLTIKNLLIYFNGKLKICNLIIKNIKKFKSIVEDMFYSHMFLIGNNIVSRINNINLINFLKKKITKIKFLTKKKEVH